MKRDRSWGSAPDVLPVPAEMVDVDGEQFTAAVRANQQHWAQTGRPISAETLRNACTWVRASLELSFAPAVRPTVPLRMVPAGQHDHQHRLE